MRFAHTAVCQFLWIVCLCLGFLSKSVSVSVSLSVSVALSLYLSFVSDPWKSVVLICLDISSFACRLENWVYLDEREDAPLKLVSHPVVAVVTAVGVAATMAPAILRHAITSFPCYCWGG